MGCGQSDAKTPQGVVTVGYWDFRAVAQPIRYFAEYLGVKWENKNYQSREAWGVDKTDLLQKGKYLANLPYLKDGEQVLYIFESSAFPIYLATRQNRLDALASNIDDKIQVAIIMGAYEDVRNAAVKVLLFMPKEEFLRTGETAFKEATRNHLKKIEYSLKGKKFILGDNPVYEDFALFEMTDTVRLFNIKFLKEFPSVFAHNENVRNIPQIKAYMTTPKFQIRPMFMREANWL